MPIYEYYCPNCDAEFEALRPASRADEAVPCKTCGTSGERQLSTFSFKSNTFSMPRLKPATKPFRSRDVETPADAPDDAASS